MTTAHSTVMKQLGPGSNLSTKKTRKARFLDEMERAVPWAALVRIVEPYCPRAKTGCPRFAIETALQIHYPQQWFCLFDSSMEEALQDTSLFREFIKIGKGVMRLPGETTRRRSCGSATCWSSTAWRRTWRVVNDMLGVKPITYVGDSSGSTANNEFRDRCSSAEIQTKLLNGSLSSIHIDGHKSPLTKARSMTSDRSHRSITKVLFCPSFVFPISDPLPKIAA